MAELAKNSISEQVKLKIETSKDFREKLDRIANGQITLFVKHCRINVVRLTEDEMFEMPIDKG